MTPLDLSRPCSRDDVTPLTRALLMGLAFERPTLDPGPGVVFALTDGGGADGIGETFEDAVEDCASGFVLVHFDDSVRGDETLADLLTLLVEYVRPMRVVALVAPQRDGAAAIAKALHTKRVDRIASVLGGAA